MTFDILKYKVSQKERNIQFSNKRTIYSKVLIFLFQYKVHTLPLIVEHYIRQMSPTALLSRGGRQCAHFKSCTLVGTPHICMNRDGKNVARCSVRQ